MERQADLALEVNGTREEEMPVFLTPATVPPDSHGEKSYGHHFPTVIMSIVYSLIFLLPAAGSGGNPVTILNLKIMTTYQEYTHVHIYIITSFRLTLKVTLMINKTHNKREVGRLGVGGLVSLNTYYHQ